ncbi:tetraspanin-21-like [Arctopsyche grandis]|uniref:tetraspanin-21-like n=1 Tax=Arctopsyche grandis TaxID=121162 RepID=UPI00406D66F0
MTDVENMVTNIRTMSSEMETSPNDERKVYKSKYIFIFLVSITLLIAITLACLMSSLDDYWSFYDPFLHVFSDLHKFGVIFTGCAISIVAMIGFIVSYTSRQSHFIWYGLALILMIILDMKVLVHGLITTNMAENYVNATMYNALESYVNSSNSWDETQKSLQCCGIRNKNDWFTVPFNDIPSTCCPHYIRICNETQSFVDPCLPKLLELSQLGMIMIYCIISILVCLKILSIVVMTSIYYKLR